MGLKKGATNNPKGRPKGSKNKVTKDVRELFSKLLESNLKQLQEDIRELSPKDRINSLLKISEFVIPKLRSVEVEGKFSEENYQEYLKLKAENELVGNMTDEELMQQVLELAKINNINSWDGSKDGFKSLD